MTKKDKICVLCLQKILLSDIYFKITLFEGKKERGTDYCHKICWDVRQGQDNLIKDLNEMTKSLKATAKNMGLIDDNKEIYLQ